MSCRVQLCDISFAQGLTCHDTPTNVRVMTQHTALADLDADHHAHVLAERLDRLVACHGTVPVSVSQLAASASDVHGESDHAAAFAILHGRRAIFTTYEGDELTGSLDFPTTGPASSGGYMVIRFDGGSWARADDLIRLTSKGA